MTRKYRNRQTAAIDGKVFSSKRERDRYQELMLLEKLGEISGLECQVKWMLIPAQPKTPDSPAERAVTWTSDFQYFTKAGKFVVEDVKSEATKTQQYVIRRKLLRWVHGVTIVEV